MCNPSRGPKCKCAATFQSTRVGPRKLAGSCVQALAWAQVHMRCHLPISSSWPTAACKLSLAILCVGPQCKYAAACRSARVGPWQLVSSHMQALVCAQVFRLCHLPINLSWPAEANRILRAGPHVGPNINMLLPADQLELARSSL
jgi:hypothetical protein